MFDDNGKVFGTLGAKAISWEIGAVVQGTKQQKGIHKARGLCGDANPAEGVNVQAAHLDVLNAAFG